MIDRKAFLLGWRTGLLIRGLRSITPGAPDIPDVPEEPDERYDVTFEGGILYIRKAPSVIVDAPDGNVLSLSVWDLENEEE